jgi:hypothetical protein
MKCFTGFSLNHVEGPVFSQFVSQAIIAIAFLEGMTWTSFGCMIEDLIEKIPADPLLFSFRTIEMWHIRPDGSEEVAEMDIRGYNQNDIQDTLKDAMTNLNFRNARNASKFRVEFIIY